MKTIVPIYQAELKESFKYEDYKLWRKWKSGRLTLVNMDMTNGNGYSVVRFKDSHIYIHRLIWTLVKGNIPEGMEVDHIDNDKSNNNINNLQLLSHRDNVAKSRNGISPSFSKSKNAYRVREQVWFGKIQHNFYFKWFNSLEDAWDCCNAYNAQFGWGKPHYHVRDGSLEYWKSCMETFKSQYLGNEVMV